MKNPSVPSLAGVSSRPSPSNARHPRISCAIQDERTPKKDPTWPAPSREQRADRVDERSAGRPARPRCRAGALEGGKPVEPLRRQPPARSGLRRQVPLPEQGASTSTRSADPRQSASCSSSRGGLSRRVSMLAPARRRAWSELRQARRLVSVARILAPAPPRRAPAPCRPRRRTGRDMRMPWLRLAGQRDQLAAFVLHLDEPVAQIRAGIVDPAVRPGGAAPGAERGRLASGKAASIASRLVRATLTRRSSGARSSSAAIRPALDQRRQLGNQPARDNPGRASRFAVAKRLRTARAPPNRTASSSGSSSARPSDCRAPALRPLGEFGGSRGTRAREPRAGPWTRHSGGS
jgi:hypothetical protein